MRSIGWAVVVACVAGTAVAGELDSATPLDGRTHRYRVPSEFVAKATQRTCGVNYSTHTMPERGQVSRQSLNVPDLRPDMLAIHWRTDNGFAGSGIKYYVRYSRLDEGGVCNAAAQVVATASYREGLVGRFPVPAYTLADAEALLAAPYLTVEGEFQATYPVDVVLSKFRRAQAEGGFEVDVGDTIVPTRINCTSAGSGARCVYSGTVEGVADRDGVLDFVAPSRAFVQALPAWVERDVTAEVRATDVRMAHERVRKIQTGTRVCQDRGDVRVFGYTEGYAAQTSKIQIRLHRTSHGHVLNEIVWDDPDRWRLCE